MAAREVSPPSDPSVAASHDWSRLRKAEPAERLLPLSKKWLELLPPDVFPGALATRYPRIVNYIAVRAPPRVARPISTSSSLISVAGGKDFQTP